MTLIIGERTIKVESDVTVVYQDGKTIVYTYGTTKLLYLNPEVVCSVTINYIK